jgi:hypothetical protein
MSKSLINTSDLRALLEANAKIEAIARALEGVDGFLLHLNSGGKEMVLSTYLSDKPRLFKRADALLKEASNIGLPSVRFDLEHKG